jgi:hypothetical protein
VRRMHAAAALLPACRGAWSFRSGAKTDEAASGLHPLEDYGVGSYGLLKTTHAINHQKPQTTLSKLRGRNKHTPSSGSCDETLTIGMLLAGANPPLSFLARVGEEVLPHLPPAPRPNVQYPRSAFHPQLWPLLMRFLARELDILHHPAHAGDEE